MERCRAPRPADRIGARQEGAESSQTHGVGVSIRPGSPLTRREPVCSRNTRERRAAGRNPRGGVGDQEVDHALERLVRYRDCLSGLAAVVAVGSAPSAADSVSGLITRTYMIVEDTDLTGDVTCDVTGAPCFSFGASGVHCGSTASRSPARPTRSPRAAGPD